MEKITKPENFDLTKLYELELGESLSIDKLTVSYLRVPGGWIYEIRTNSGEWCNSVFIPYNEEFRPGFEQY